MRLEALRALRCDLRLKGLVVTTCGAEGEGRSLAVPGGMRGCCFCAAGNSGAKKRPRIRGSRGRLLSPLCVAFLRRGEEPFGGVSVLVPEIRPDSRSNRALGDLIRIPAADGRSGGRCRRIGHGFVAAGADGEDAETENQKHHLSLHTLTVYHIRQRRQESDRLSDQKCLDSPRRGGRRASL